MGMGKTGILAGTDSLRTGMSLGEWYWGQVWALVFVSKQVWVNKSYRNLLVQVEVYHMTYN